MALQMGVFKASGRKRRLFRMSPIHHHFELVGWPETTVIIRFWLISAICVAAALGAVHRRLHADRAVADERALPGVRVGGRGRGRRARADPARYRGRRRRRHSRRNAGGSWPRTLGVELADRPRYRRARALVGRAISCARRRACPRPTPVFEVAAPAGVRVAQRDRTGLPLGAGAVRRAAADARRHRDRREDHHDAVAVEMLRAGGVRTVAAGNTDVPLVDAIDLDVDAFVVECTSFRLAWTTERSAPRRRRGSTSRPTTSTGTLDGVVRGGQGPGSSPSNGPTDTAIGAAADPVVMAAPRVGTGPRTARSVCTTPTTASPATWLHGPPGALAPTDALAAQPAPRPHERSGGRGAGPRDRGWSGPTRSPRAWPRSPGRRTASSWSARATASVGTTTRRRRRRTPRRRRSGLRQHRADRRRAEQGTRPVDRWPASATRDPRRRRHRPRRQGHRGGLRRVDRRRGNVDGRGRRARRRAGRALATSCCSRPDAPASTGTPTAATRHGATTSAASWTHD